jgi:hypothetical protein
MPYNPHAHPPTPPSQEGRHHRRSIRLKGYDYSQTGGYFVTVCTEHRGCLLGEIIDGEMNLNDLGRLIEQLRNGRSICEINRYKNQSV